MKNINYHIPRGLTAAEVEDLGLTQEQKRMEENDGPSPCLSTRASILLKFLKLIIDFAQRFSEDVTT